MAANGFYAKPKVSYAADNGFYEMRFKPPSHANNTPPRSITTLKELSPAPCNLSLPLLRHVSRKALKTGISLECSIIPPNLAIRYNPPHSGIKGALPKKQKRAKFTQNIKAAPPNARLMRRALFCADYFYQDTPTAP